MVSYWVVDLQREAAIAARAVDWKPPFSYLPSLYESSGRGPPLQTPSPVDAVDPPEYTVVVVPHQQGLFGVWHSHPRSHPLVP
jgi:hypothetical protein